MITIEGTAITPGIAIAAAAVVDAPRGINAVSPVILQEGINALRKQSHPNDYPEAIVVCDMLALGMAMKIPGVNTIAIAAESAAEVPGAQIDVPCVIGLPSLLKSISQDDIVIVDGDKGVVHIDPDPQTVVLYQHLQDEAHPHSVFVLEEEPTATQTRTGQAVNVYAWVADQSELDAALEQGADGLVVHAWPGTYEEILHRVAGKRIAFAERRAESDVLRASMHYAVPQQVTVLFPGPDFEVLSTEMAAIARELARELELDESEPLWVNLGALSHEVEASEEAEVVPSFLFIDLHESPHIDAETQELQDLFQLAVGEREKPEKIFLLGNRLDALERLVAAGAGNVAVAAELVAECKRLIADMEL